MQVLQWRGVRRRPGTSLVLQEEAIRINPKSNNLNEHEAAKWLGKDELDSVKWLPADVKVVEVMNKTI